MSLEFGAYVPVETGYGFPLPIMLQPQPWYEQL